MRERRGKKDNDPVDIWVGRRFSLLSLTLIFSTTFTNGRGWGEQKGKLPIRRRSGEPDIKCSHESDEKWEDERPLQTSRSESHRDDCCRRSSLSSILPDPQRAVCVVGTTVLLPLATFKAAA